MTIDEAKKLLAVAATAYPMHFKNEDSMALERQASLWAQTTIGTYQEANKALKAYIMTNESGWPPDPGKLNAIIRSDTIEMGAAKDMVTRAIRNGLYHAEEEFEKLPPLIQRAIGGPAILREWAKSDAESIQSVIMSQFTKLYLAAIERTNIDDAMGRPQLPGYEAPQIEAKEEPEPEYRDRTKDIEELKKRLGL